MTGPVNQMLASERLRVAMAVARPAGSIELNRDAALSILAELRRARDREAALAALDEAERRNYDLMAEHEALVARAERAVRRSIGAALLWGGVLLLLVALAALVVFA